MNIKTLFAAAAMGAVVSLAVGATAASASTSAYSTDIDLSAITAAGATPTSANGVTLNLAAGNYDISAIMGAYTAAQLAYGGQYSVPFTVSYTGYDEIYYLASSAGAYQAVFSTAAQALAAFQAGPVVAQNGLNAAAAPVTLTGPITLNLTSPTAVNFSVTDYGQTYDNSGGVSLAITSAVTSAAPEPATWLLMIVGVGLAGCAMRRRLQGVALAA